MAVPAVTDRREFIPSSAMAFSLSTLQLAFALPRARLRAVFARSSGVQWLPGRFARLRARLMPLPIPAPRSRAPRRLRAVAASPVATVKRLRGAAGLGEETVSV